ncbi:unnamed protein product [Adineta ricciae]|uniref:Uncharacterized protein n=1 Tax=Adineta ricciae TaxID=249248 RepID=A0A815FZ46_ADIRI|nr:unnamed protein product [Adineta ricciae]
MQFRFQESDRMGKRVTIVNQLIEKFQIPIQINSNSYWSIISQVVLMPSAAENSQNCSELAKRIYLEGLFLVF